MSAYVKISYPSEKYNYAMRECIKLSESILEEVVEIPIKREKELLQKK